MSMPNCSTFITAGLEHILVHRTMMERGPVLASVELGREYILTMKSFVQDLQDI